MFSDHKHMPHSVSVKPVVNALILGPHRSGKSKFLFRLSNIVTDCKQEYDDEYTPTPTGDYQQVKLPNGIRLDCIDASGDESYARIVATMYYRDKQIAFLCFDGENEFDLHEREIEHQLHEIRTASPDITVFCLIMKSDKTKSEHLELNSFLKNHQVDLKNVFKCSAKDNIGFDVNGKFITRLCVVAKEIADPDPQVKKLRDEQKFKANQIAIFKKVYAALREGQTKLFKSNFLNSLPHDADVNTTYNLIMEHAKQQGSRSAQALKLMNEHVAKDSDAKQLGKNTKLFEAAYLWAYENSRFFSKSNTFSGSGFCQTLFKTSTVARYVANADLEKNPPLPTSRAGKMKSILS